MNYQEYLKVKDFTYLQYCDYLQNKYGIGLDDFMTPNFHSKPKCKRTSEGLFAHHKMEDHALLLSDKEVASSCPFEWQSKKNIVYCDLLEHLFLHILICKYPAEDRIDEVVGFPGIVTFLVPELNDVYAGHNTKQQWKRICHNKVINDKEVYFALLKQLFSLYREDKDFDINMFLTSFANVYSGKNSDTDIKLYNEIQQLYLQSKYKIKI